MEFLGHCFQKLEHEQDRQTHRQMEPNALPAAFLQVFNIPVRVMLLQKRCGDTLHKVYIYSVRK